MALSRQQVEHRGQAGARTVYLGRDRLVARVLGKYTMVLDGTDLSITPHLALNGVWESWVTAWVTEQPLMDQRVINVGANCGYFTMLFADLVGEVGRVVAMEPQAHLADMCRESALLNGFQARVEVLRMAAGASRTTETLYVPSTTNASAQLRTPPKLLVGEMEECHVPVMRADVAMEGATFAFVDAEGYEPEVWAGMSEMKQLRTLVMEWTPARYSDPGGFFQQLRDAGFHATYIHPVKGEIPATEFDILGPAEDFWCMLVLRR